MSQISDEFRNTQEFFQAGSMVCRVFVHPEVRIRINASARADEIAAGILRRLAGTE
jgi:hypothetical protein